MIKSVINSLRKQIEDRRRYQRAVAEIETLTQRDLAYLRADPVEMARHAYVSIYGKAAA